MSTKIRFHTKLHGSLVTSATIFLTAFLGLASDAQAQFEDQRQIVDWGASSEWQTTTDFELGQQWLAGNFHPTEGVPATVPYGNTATPALNANRMMWNCEPGTNCTFDNRGNALATGPTEAFFGFRFEVPPEARLEAGNIDIIADDYFELYINGNLIEFGLLDHHKDSVGQPAPLQVGGNELAPAFRSGANVISVHAMDGHLGIPCPPGNTRSTARGSFCLQNRVFEYLYVSGSGVFNVPADIPQPSTVGLFVVSLAGLGLAARRRKFSA
jgi:hypothetical protein